MFGTDTFRQKYPCLCGACFATVFPRRIICCGEELFRMRILCAYGCGESMSANHLFLECDVPNTVWLHVRHWIGIPTVFPCQVMEHHSQFTLLAGIPRSSQCVFKVIWFACVWVIWKDRNDRVFKNTGSHSSVLREKIKLHSFLWLKAKWPSFHLCCDDWWQRPLHCMSVRL